MPNVGPTIHSFDLFVIGSGGGPHETNLSAYLLKPANCLWDDGIIALEAGSGIGALDVLLRNNISLFQRPSNKKRFSAAKIYSFVKCFLITHAHLDHVNALVLSAGSLSGNPKRIYAIQETLLDLQQHIFAGRIWPELARSEDEQDDRAQLICSTLDPVNEYTDIFPGVSVRTFLLSHGRNSHGPYNSTAFLLRNTNTCQEFLFFGDTGPDFPGSDALLKTIWNTVAPNIGRSLCSIFIECSWPSGRKDDELFGHLSPEHLCSELISLARSVHQSRIESTLKATPRNGNGPSHTGDHKTPLSDSENDEDARLGGDGGPSSRKRRRLNPGIDLEEDLCGALSGLTVYITHCKDNMNLDASPDDPPLRTIISQQINDLVEENKLGARIIAVEPGMQLKL